MCHDRQGFTVLDEDCEIFGHWDELEADFVAQTDNIDPPDNDIINQPNHYTFRGGIEPIDFIRSNNLSFCEGSIIKYLYRHPSKNGVEDLKKARRNLDWMIADMEKRNAAQG